MAKKYTPQLAPVPKQFSAPDEIDRGIAKLTRRLQELEGLKGLHHDDPRIDNAAQNVQAAILDVFGSTSPEYEKHRHFSLSSGSFHILPYWHGGL